MNHALLLDGKGSAKELTYEDINGASLPNNGILWVHFDYSSQMAKDWIKNKSGIDSVAIDALLTEETRPRTTVLNDSFLIALRGVNLNPNSKPEDMISIRLYVSENLIISTKRRDLLSVRDVVNLLKINKGPKSSSEFLIDLTHSLTARMKDVIDQLEDRTDFLEENLLNTTDSKLRNEISTIRREAITLRRYLFPQKDAMNKLFHDNINWINEYEKVRLREVTDQLIRYIEELDNIKDRVVLIQEELINTLSEQMNKKMYVLSIISVIFLPLTFLTGLLGINVQGIPGAQNEMAFFIFVLILLGVVTFQLLLFKKKKWI